MRYNIDVLNYLMNFFIDIINNMGKTNQAIAFYKKQVDGLYNLNQLDRKHRLIIYKLLGISGPLQSITVDWNKLDSDLQKFNHIVNCTYQSNCINAYEFSIGLCIEQQASDLVRSLIKDVFPKPEPKPKIKTSRYDRSSYYSCGLGGSYGGSRMC